MKIVFNTVDWSLKLRSDMWYIGCVWTVVRACEVGVEIVSKFISYTYVHGSCKLDVHSHVKI